MTDDGMPPFDDFERELEDLGPLMVRQEMALASEPDPEFVRSLRNRLIGETAPVRARRESFRERLSDWGRRYWLPGGGLAAAAVVALIVVLGNNRGTGPNSTQSAFAVPTPNRSDVTRSYPSPGGLGAGGPQPVWYSNLQPPPGAPYAGHLSLKGKSLPSVAEQAHAYRLDGPAFDLPRLRSLAATLGISGSVRHFSVEDGRWAYIAQQSGPTQLHSIAINVRTGELVYHDSRVNAPVPPRVTDKEQAEARAWLSKLGWPAGSMPYRQPATAQEAVLPWVVHLNWPQTGADVPAASIALDRSGRVTDALLEPPISAMRAVTLESRQAAWNTLRQRGGPVGVEGVVGLPAKPGTAVLTHAQVVKILTRASDGTGYLAPSYRFEGRATIQGVPGSRHWFAIVPAVG